MIDKICAIIDAVRKNKPLIHCITNPISINQCANTILSVGAKPIMAEHPSEVREITVASNALMLNIGNITDARMESILISMEAAKANNIPGLLDVVGIACSKFRREYITNFLKKFTPNVIKGNYSEIKALYDEEYFSSGVDAEDSISTRDITTAVSELAKKYKTVILATGKKDVIADGKQVVYVKNGTLQLADITGSGCMLGSLCAAFMTFATPMDASVSACCCFGICGEISETKKGNGSFMMNLIDNISTLNREKIRDYLNVEERKNEGTGYKTISDN